MQTKIDSLIGGAMRPSHGSKTHTDAISTIDTHFRRAAIGSIMTYITLVLGVYYAVPSEQIVSLEGVEQNSAIMAMALIAISLVSRFIQMGGQVDRGRKLKLSGVFIGGLTVQIIALVTDTLLAFFPTPLVMDPVLGTRVHVLRWCEWCPCAAYMAFMMEGSDLYWKGEYPPSGYLLSKYIHASMQGGAVFLGLCFPFCPGLRSWMACMIVACCLYLTNYPRMWQRKRAIPSSLHAGATIEEKERFHSAKIALRLRFVTTLVWSVIVGLFFASSVIGPKFAPPESFLRSPAANMMCECFFDVLSKVLFLQVILEVHSAVFDPYARMERRMEELHQLLATVWDSSTDMIGISVRVGKNAGASVLLSPAFFSLGRGKDGQQHHHRDQLSKEHENSYSILRKSILYQIAGSAFNVDANSGEDISPNVKHDIINVQETGFSLMDTVAGKFIVDESTLSGVSAVSGILIKAWTSETRDHEFTHNLQWASLVGADPSSKHTIRVEAKVSRLDDNSLIVIVRDISERVRAFEAEKQVLLETTTRVKDEEANRFTRHEVKNGLLSAIGLYESLCEAHKVELMKSFNQNEDISIDSDENGSFQHVFRCMSDLGKCLHDTLDTILVEAMTRDLVHDIYRPEREKIYLPSLLSGFTDEVTHSIMMGGGGDSSRFSIEAQPSPFPMISTDPRLLRYLHRQAVSNACKFGKASGPVLTEIIYNEERQNVQINVKNLPGKYHDRLVAMGSAAEALVFKKGYHLHEVLSDEANGVSNRSPANAQPSTSAWIIQKGARIMKGDCSIKFKESGTEFSLTFPAKPLKSRQEKRLSDGSNEVVQKFALPVNTWGIAIDDAKVQMKLLGKLFEFAGIQKDRIKLFGQDSDEIMKFVDYMVNFFDENKEDYVLLIADENLDVMDGASKHMTMSGSQMVETIRSRLLPEQEKRLVALIRSANDSLSDVALYEARAHGYLPKAPIKRGEVLQKIKPVWIARCPESYEGDESRSGRPRSDSFDSVSSFNVVTATPTEIFQTVHEIDELFSTELVEENWEHIWEKLHVLKGDLLSTLEVGSQIVSAVGTVDHFRDLTSIIVRKERWELLRRKILHCVHMNEDFEPFLTG